MGSAECKIQGAQGGRGRIGRVPAPHQGPVATRVTTQGSKVKQGGLGTPSTKTVLPSSAGHSQGDPGENKGAQTRSLTGAQESGVRGSKVRTLSVAHPGGAGAASEKSGALLAWPKAGLRPGIPAARSRRAVTFSRSRAPLSNPGRLTHGRGLATGRPRAGAGTRAAAQPMGVRIESLGRDMRARRHTGARRASGGGGSVANGLRERARRRSPGGADSQ